MSIDDTISLGSNRLATRTIHGQGILVNFVLFVCRLNDPDNDYDNYHHYHNTDYYYDYNTNDYYNYYTYNHHNSYNHHHPKT